MVHEFSLLSRCIAVVLLTVSVDIISAQTANPSQLLPLATGRDTVTNGHSHGMFC